MKREGGEYEDDEGNDMLRVSGCHTDAAGGGGC